ncbi:hypothetical protein T484DRAFT_1813992 [Baffinella frigidus]|nr:hypothetical protein T484DRAFT_1813992 [Cryptophyta sp. CCMP2293]
MESGASSEDEGVLASASQFSPGSPARPFGSSPAFPPRPSPEAGPSVPRRALGKVLELKNIDPAASSPKRG